MEPGRPADSLRLPLRFAVAVLVYSFGSLASAADLPRFESSDTRGELLAPQSPPAVLDGPTTITIADADDSVSQAALRLQAANQLQAQNSDHCVDAFYEAAILAWQFLAASPLDFDQQPQQPAALAIYEQSLAQLLIEGQRFGRLNPGRGLTIVASDRTHTVPIALHGFAWLPGDFSDLLLAEFYRNDNIKRHFANSGIGVPLVAVRVAPEEEPFFRRRQPFGATAVLRARSFAGDFESPRAMLDFYNPCVFSQIEVGARTARLARDMTAPFVVSELDNPRQALRAFREPTEVNLRPKLVMLEPYQRGKIPVVFIHGLLSDPYTWVDLVNELRAQPDIYAHFQFWAFRYPTGGAVLDSAADLRDLLNVLRGSFDPGCPDPALEQMVLIGHSMGGLVSKLQVCESYDLLWRRIACKPFCEVRGSPQILARFSRSVFFHPVPSVRRLVFIGTPHHGSGLSRRLIGRVGSALVTYTNQDAQYAEFIDANRDIFIPEMPRRRPTSIDILEPDSPVLAALSEMPISPGVALHSIIGTGGSRLALEPGDGVVPVASARHPGVASELFVPATHTALHHHPMTIQEISRILREHWTSAAVEMDSQMSGAAVVSAWPAKSDGNLSGRHRSAMALVH